MHRPTIGAIAVVLLGAAAVLNFLPESWGSFPGLLAACLRVGILMAALWLAHPQLHRLPVWLLGSIVVSAMAVALRPRLALVAVPLVVALWALASWRRPMA
jgi:hypothetical protein